MNSSLTFAEYAPLVIMIIMTIMMIEAAGSVDVNTMIPLPGKSDTFDIAEFFKWPITGEF